MGAVTVIVFITDVRAPLRFYPRRDHAMTFSRPAACAALLAGVALLGSACSASPGSTAAADSSATINAVGAENEYADVLAQIGGAYVHVSSILNNPNTDPHSFEASPSVAEEVSQAQLIVQNGIGYDTFMDKIESAAPNAHRKVIVAQHVLGLPDGTPNPHLWYSPATMPAVAKAIATDLAGLQPAHAAYFRALGRGLRCLTAAVGPGAGPVQGGLPRHSRGRHRARRRLHAGRPRARATSPRSASRPT